jgi:O-acetyl-ADP-ribose deacetylase (regulator of RNase III)
MTKLLASSRLTSTGLPDSQRAAPSTRATFIASFDAYEHFGRRTPEVLETARATGPDGIADLDILRAWLAIDGDPAPEHPLTGRLLARVRDLLQAREAAGWQAPPLTRLSVVEADITTLAVDAIVNAAHESLLGGGGVDGAIHRAAGRGLLAECRRLGGCRPGQAKSTGGHRLPARRIIHTVGPIWMGGGHGEAAELASCYWQSCLAARADGCRTIAFPCVSTGVFGYPHQAACQIAVATVRCFCLAYDDLEEVQFCCFCAEQAGLYRREMAPLPAIRSPFPPCDDVGMTSQVPDRA